MSLRLPLRNGFYCPEWDIWRMVRPSLTGAACGVA